MLVIVHNRYYSNQCTTFLNLFQSSSLKFIVELMNTFCGLNRPPFLGDTNLCLATSPAIENRKYDVKKKLRQELHFIHIVLLETYGNISCRGMVVQVWWIFVKMIEFNIECH